MTSRDQPTVDQLLDAFLGARTQHQVLETFSQIRSKVTNNQHLKCSISLYHELKKVLVSWRAQSIWKILDERVKHPVYAQNSVCQDKKILVIGAGPIGLRMAVECSFLGAETHIIEKRTSMTRNNILHLWPFTIDDLRRLGAKKFYGQFCAGAIDHISTRQLQLIMLKICCLLGVHIHVGVEFIGIEEPDNKKTNGVGWGITVSPHPPPLPKYGWEVIVQASGRQHVLPLFQYKECRGQQAIGMTCNFVNRGTMEELTIEEISGIAFIYNQEFFNDMYTEVGIALENIVYYKDETHYFVMSTKKHSLLSKRVLKKDYPTTTELLSPDNIDLDKAQQFAKEVAGFATNLPVLEFMTNHYNKPDVAIFDFSAIKIAANSTMVVERKGHKLLMCLVGDSLMEPFWPQGTGCARGFLSVLNSAWMFKKYYENVPIYEVLRERESLFKLLAQSSPMKLSNKYDKYTIDPTTRYNFFNNSTERFEVFHLYNKDDSTPLQNNNSTAVVPHKSEKRSRGKPRDQRRKTVHHVTLVREKTPLVSQSPPTPTLEQGKLLNWAREGTCGYAGVRVTNLTTSWKSGLAFCALIHRHRPDILNFTAVSKLKTEQVLNTVFQTTNKELGIKSPFSATDLANSSIPDRHKIVMYLTCLYNHFTSEESKSLQILPDMCYYCTRHITPDQLTSSHGIKFHASCLKCEYCLDKISINTLHFVTEKIASEYAKRRKPEYKDLKSGFYCKFHFKEFFTPSSLSLYPPNWDKETEIISPDTSACSNHDNEEITNKTDPLITQKQQPSDDARYSMRRAKSVSCVKNLCDMFEHISTAKLSESRDNVTSEQKPLVGKISDKILSRKVPRPTLETIPKSKSFSAGSYQKSIVTSTPNTETTSPCDNKTANQSSGYYTPQISRRNQTETYTCSAGLSISPNNATCYSPSPNGREGSVSSRCSINLDHLKYPSLGDKTDDKTGEFRGGRNKKKKKSGIAKKIDKRRASMLQNPSPPAPTSPDKPNLRRVSSTASFDLGSLKYSKSSPCLGEQQSTDSHVTCNNDVIMSNDRHDNVLHDPVIINPTVTMSHNDSIQITSTAVLSRDNSAKKRGSNVFKFFKKRQHSNDKVDVKDSKSGQNAISSPDLVIERNPDSELQNPDPTYTIPVPQYINNTKTANRCNSNFTRNSFARKTAPPKLRSPSGSDNDVTFDNDADNELVDSSLCRRSSGTLHREAMILQTNSPQARTLLRSSLRNSKRNSANSPLIKQNRVYQDHSPDKARTAIVALPIPVKTINPINQEPKDEDTGVLAVKVYSPKPRRARKVTMPNDSNSSKQTVSSPKLQRQPKSSSPTTHLQRVIKSPKLPRREQVQHVTDPDVEIVKHQICSPKLQRATKVIVNKKANIPQAKTLLPYPDDDGFDTSSSSSDIPPARPAPPTDFISSPEHSSLSPEETAFISSPPEVSITSSPDYLPSSEGPTPPARPSPPRDYELPEDVILRSLTKSASSGDMTPASSDLTPRIDDNTLNPSNLTSRRRDSRLLSPVALAVVESNSDIEYSNVINSKEVLEINDVKQSTSSLTRDSSRDTSSVPAARETTSVRGLPDSSSFDSPGQIRACMSTVSSATHGTQSDIGSSFDNLSVDLTVGRTMPFLLKLQDIDLDLNLDTTLSGDGNGAIIEDMTEIRSESLTNSLSGGPQIPVKQFTYAKQRSSSGSTPPKEDQTNNMLLSSQHTKQPSEYKKPPSVERPRLDRLPSAFSRSVDHAPNKQRAVNRVLQRSNTSPSEHASITSILAKYKRPKSFSSLENNSDNDKDSHNRNSTDFNNRNSKNYDTADDKISVTMDNTRSTTVNSTVSTNTSDRSPEYNKVSYKRQPKKQQERGGTALVRDNAPIGGKTPSTQNRVKMITQLSASFDKTIDKLVSKYHKSTTHSPNKSSAQDTSTDSRDSKSSSRDRKSSAYRRSTACDKVVDEIAENTPPSAAFVRRRTDTELAMSCGNNYKSRDHKSKTRDRDIRDTETHDRETRELIPINPSLLRYDKNSSLKERNDNKSAPTRSRSHTIPQKEPEQLDRYRYTTTGGSTQNQKRSRNIQHSQNRDRHRDEDTQNRDQNTQHRDSYRGDRKSRHQSNSSDKEVSYIVSEEEGGTKKKNFNYLKSLYYQYSSPQDVSDKVDPPLKVVQRKQTDV